MNTKPYRNAERTKRWIRKAFTELIAEKKDIEKITVSELAERADISKTTFYYHYEDIYAVAEEFENKLIDHLPESLAEFGKESSPEAADFRLYARGIISFLKENEESYRIVMGASSPRLFAEKFKKIIARKVTENVSHSHFTQDPRIWAVQICFLSSACVDVIIEYSRGSFSVSFDDVADVIIDAVEKLRVIGK